jgi:antitoxin CptB
MADFMADENIRIKRMLYRARHRGTKEMDFVIGRFADAELTVLNEAELGAFEMLLGFPDQTVDSWIKGAEPPETMMSIVARIRRHHRLED